MSIPAGKVFTEEDLASADDRVLVAVDGKVFDVTDFLESHPGVIPNASTVVFS